MVADYAIGIALTAAVLVVYFIVIYRLKHKHKFGVVDLVYDKKNSRIELHLKNKGEKPYYVKPSLRLVKSLIVPEWQTPYPGTSNAPSFDAIPMMTGSNIQKNTAVGYELLGEYSEPVILEADKTVKFVYNLDNSVELNHCDNVKVDVAYGRHDKGLNDTINTVVQVRLRGGGYCDVEDKASKTSEYGGGGVDGAVVRVDGDILELLERIDGKILETQLKEKSSRSTAERRLFERQEKMLDKIKHRIESCRKEIDDSVSEVSEHKKDSV